MPIGGVCAEIGVWEGDFSLRILEITRPRELQMIIRKAAGGKVE